MTSRAAQRPIDGQGLAGRKALIVGLSGLELTAEEARYLACERPAGLILFARNVASPDQVRGLISAALSAIGSPATLTLIDQEGGRVRRLRPPHWRPLPSAAAYARLFAADQEAAVDAARRIAMLTADDLRAIGLNTNCAPVLEVPAEGAHDVIGDRAYGSAAHQVVMLGRAVASGLASQGVLPVMKHIPGHGRARADSHLELPVVEAAKDELDWTDFAPFWALNDLPAAMTAHVVFTAIDPDRPASTSPAVIDTVIRREIGFDGLLMSDDLGMKALQGGMRERAASVIAAGSDLALHCSGRLEEMAEAAAGVPLLTPQAVERLGRCLELIAHPVGPPLDRRAAEQALERVLALDVGAPTAGA